jgi:hypothetical protein
VIARFSDIIDKCNSISKDSSQEAFNRNFCLHSYYHPFFINKLMPLSLEDLHGQVNVTLHYYNKEKRRKLGKVSTIYTHYLSMLLYASLLKYNQTDSMLVSLYVLPEKGKLSFVTKIWYKGGIPIDVLLPPSSSAK